MQERSGAIFVLATATAGKPTQGDNPISNQRQVRTFVAICLMHLGAAEPPPERPDRQVRYYLAAVAVAAAVVLIGQLVVPALFGKGEPRGASSGGTPSVKPPLALPGGAQSGTWDGPIDVLGMAQFDLETWTQTDGAGDLRFGPDTMLDPVNGARIGVYLGDGPIAAASCDGVPTFPEPLALEVGARVCLVTGDGGQALMERVEGPEQQMNLLVVRGRG